MSQLFVDGVIELAKLNPNKFTAIEQLALERVENKSHEAQSWINISIMRSPEKDTLKLKEVVKYYSYLISSCEMMSSSYLLRPVRGHVIQRDRKMISKYMVSAQKILDAHGIK